MWPAGKHLAKRLAEQQPQGTLPPRPPYAPGRPGQARARLRLLQRGAQAAPLQPLHGHQQQRALHRTTSRRSGQWGTAARRGGKGWQTRPGATQPRHTGWCCCTAVECTADGFQSRQTREASAPGRRRPAAARCVGARSCAAVEPPARPRQSRCQGGARTPGGRERGSFILSNTHSLTQHQSIIIHQERAWRQHTGQCRPLERYMEAAPQLTAGPGVHALCTHLPCLPAPAHAWPSRHAKQRCRHRGQPQQSPAKPSDEPQTDVP